MDIRKSLPAFGSHFVSCFAHDDEVIDNSPLHNTIMTETVPIKTFDELCDLIRSAENVK